MGLAVCLETAHTQCSKKETQHMQMNVHEYKPGCNFISEHKYKATDITGTTQMKRRMQKPGPFFDTQQI